MSPRTQRVLPTIEPIIVVNDSPPLQDPRWIYEPKFDGFRGVLYVCGRGCLIRPKRGNVLRRFADLALRVGAELHARDAILDGEVVALDDEGRMDFRALLAGKGWLHSSAPWQRRHRSRLPRVFLARCSTSSAVGAVTIRLATVFRSGNFQEEVGESGAPMMKKQPGISANLRKFRETRNPLPLVQAIMQVVSQGRTIELMYGGYCSVFHRPSPVCPCENEETLSSILARQSEFVHDGTLSRGRLTELFGEAFAVRSLPADFRSARCESVWREGDRLIAGEYGDNSRLAYITTESCVISDYYQHIPGVRHIHSIQRHGDSGEFLVSTGDTRKFLDLWALSRGRMRFTRRLRRRLAGFTAAIEVNGEYFFGSDFSSRPNFIETLGGRRYFFPEKAYKLRADLFYAFFDRYIAAINKELDVLGSRRTLSVFDTVKEKFVFCDHLNLDAIPPASHPDAASP